MPARGGNDAEGAAIAAAVLHFQVWPGLKRVKGEGQSGQLGVGEGVIVEDLRRERTEGNEGRLIGAMIGRSGGETEGDFRHF